MTTTAPEPEPSPPLWVERIGTKTYTGRNDRGAEVRIGPHTDDGVFSPGELLKIALAACSGMSAERAVHRRIGHETSVRVGVRSVPGPGQNRYATLLTELVVPAGDLPPDQHEQLVSVALKAIAVGCTVGRTLEAGAHVEVSVTDEAVTDEAGTDEVTATGEA